MINEVLTLKKLNFSPFLIHTLLYYHNSLHALISVIYRDPSFSTSLAIITDLLIPKTIIRNEG